jgi:nucleotide-binding universal stress UspA family protein
VVLGSVGEVLVAGSPTAVAVAPKGFAARAPEEMRVVGAGFNGSPEARLALRAAATLAAGAGAELRAIAVEEGFAHAHHPIRPEYRAESRLVEQLDHALEEVGAPDAKRVVEKGAAVHCLCEASRETDLLVIGSRGYGPMRHALVGSVSAQLMRSAPVPVLVIPRGAGTEDGTGEGIAVGAPTRA